MNMSNIRTLCILVLAMFLLSTTISVNSATSTQPTIEEDFDPLVDIEITVEIQKIRSFDKRDLQLFVNMSIVKVTLISI